MKFQQNSQDEATPNSEAIPHRPKPYFYKSPAASRHWFGQCVCRGAQHMHLGTVLTHRALQSPHLERDLEDAEEQQLDRLRVRAETEAHLRLVGQRQQ